MQTIVSQAATDSAGKSSRGRHVLVGRPPKPTQQATRLRTRADGRRRGKFVWRDESVPTAQPSHRQQTSAGVFWPVIAVPAFAELVEPRVPGLAALQWPFHVAAE